MRDETDNEIVTTTKGDFETTTQIEIIEDDIESELSTEKEEDIETITEAKRETFLNRAILDKDISEQGVKGIGPVREEMDSNMEDEKKKKKVEEEEALTGPRSRTHVGLKEEKKVWKQELLNKWMAPKEDKEIDRESMIQKDNWKDTYHHKKRNRKKKACIDSNQRKVTNWFCKVQKAENEQERLE